jgi:hypothetical protein
VTRGAPGSKTVPLVPKLAHIARPSFITSEGSAGSSSVSLPPGCGTGVSSSEHADNAKRQTAPKKLVNSLFMIYFIF